jgi:hypothetical protein
VVGIASLLSRCVVPRCLRIGCGTARRSLSAIQRCASALIRLNDHGSTLHSVPYQAKTTEITKKRSVSKPSSSPCTFSYGVGWGFHDELTSTRKSTNVRVAAFLFHHFSLLEMKAEGFLVLLFSSCVKCSERGELFFFNDSGGAGN